MEEVLLGAYLALLLIIVFWPVVRYAYKCAQRRWFPNRWLERELRLREEELSRTAPTIYTDRSSTVYTELQESEADANSYPWEDYAVTIREDERPNPRIQELRDEITLVKSAQASLTLGDRGALDSLRLEFEGVDLDSFAGVAGGLPGFVFGLRLAGDLWWDKVGDDPFFVGLPEVVWVKWGH